MCPVYGGHIPGRAGADGVQAVHARLVLRRRCGGGAALRGGLVLERSRPHQRRPVHADGQGPPRANGQHRADHVQPRHGPAPRRQGRVRQVRGRHVPGGRGQADVCTMRGGLLLPRGRQRGAAVQGGLLLTLDGPHQRRWLHGHRCRPLRVDGQHRADTVQPRHYCAAAEDWPVRQVRRRQLSGGCWRHGVRPLRRWVLLPHRRRRRPALRCGHLQQRHWCRPEA